MRWVTIILFALFAAVFIWFERDGSFSVFLKSKDESVALTKGSEDETNIALTFNISWGKEKVDDILKKLKENLFSIVLTEGKNRQIRRMTEKLGYTVTDLRRIRVQNIEIGKLASNAHREIVSEEKEKFLSSLDLK